MSDVALYVKRGVPVKLTSKTTSASTVQKETIVALPVTERTLPVAVEKSVVVAATILAHWACRTTP